MMRTCESEELSAPPGALRTILDSPVCVCRREAHEGVEIGVAAAHDRCDVCERLARGGGLVAERRKGRREQRGESDCACGFHNLFELAEGKARGGCDGGVVDGENGGIDERARDRPRACAERLRTDRVRARVAGGGHAARREGHAASPRRLWIDSGASLSRQPLAPASRASLSRQPLAPASGDSPSHSLALPRTPSHSLEFPRIPSQSLTLSRVREHPSGASRPSEALASMVERGTLESGTRWSGARWNGRTGDGAPRWSLASASPSRLPSGSTAITRTDGRSARAAAAMPPSMPPPEVGTRMASSCGHCRNSSRAMVPWPAMTASSSYGWTSVCETRARAACRRPACNRVAMLGLSGDP
eukprot:2077722-Prymnesium_polylepis.1